ncbi:MAG: cell division protein FtsZ [Chitinophagaceae bacterium]|nr:cell division protein FtsZ [Chitinophagaceae bacterium]
MIQFDLPNEQSSIIKVIGVGGGGSNAVNYMHSLGIDGVDFIVCNTDAQALALSKVPNKIQLGPSLTQGLGAGANPEIGRQATEESLDEIRRILEVNTKMAFVTAGMGGGTGTGGAPIISKICKDMGILTVGIITTPFSYEGKKRALHADSGIQQMKSQVDTLLVISNDKLRHQFGNLTMSAALSTADNVLATAAKCITDVINTTGQINVDFADVCTVMRNGGVAILGSARAQGEDRAQVAIQQALNSPLLNDSDIKGAKWVLININSRMGVNEFTMDEVETIQEYLLTQAGPDADVILGLGYDESLGEEISITIIATGFEQKSPFGEEKPEIRQEPKDEKIMFTLDVTPQPKAEMINMVPVQELAEVKTELPEIEEPVAMQEEQEEEPVVEHIELKSEYAPTLVIESTTVVEETILLQETVAQVEEPVFVEEEGPIVFELDLTIKESPVMAETVASPDMAVVEEQKQEEIKPAVVAPVASNALDSFLKRPANIYADEVNAESQPTAQVSEPEMPEVHSSSIELVEKVEMEADHSPELSTLNPQPSTHNPQPSQELKEVEEPFEMIYHEESLPKAVVEEEPNLSSAFVQEIAALDEAEVQKARAAERLQKLRNLSFNFSAADPNNEYESIPAYVRQNLQVHNTTLASVEKFYSSYAVGTDENNVTQISTINTFLEGKKPD